MRNVKRLIAVVMAVIMLFSVVPTNVFAATGSKNLISTDKAVYELGEQFKITVHSYENSNDWVAVYNATSSTTPINGWYYVNHWYYPEKDGTKDANGWSYTFDSLGAGYYRAYLLKSDGYEVMDYVDFEIKSNDNLSLDKDVYHLGEDIKVTAIGSGDDWVGLYEYDDRYGSGAGTIPSLYWYTVDSSKSGKPYVINNSNDFNTDRNTTIKVGTYKVILFPNGGYTPSAIKKISVVDHTYSSTKITKKATFTDAGLIKTVCSCGAENGATTAIPAVSDVTLEYTTVQLENGKTYTPAVTVKDSTGTLVPSENYDVAYKDNDKVGNATVTVTLKGDKYEGSKELAFEITQAAHTHNYNTEAVKTKATFTAEGVIANKCVCGEFEVGSEKAIPAVSSVTLDTDTALTGGTPSVTVMDSADKALVKDTDYTVSYSDNGSVGTATATVTLKGEFYEGTKAVNYNVIPFTVNKTDLCYGEDLIVKANDCGNSSWVGIYKDGEGYNPDNGGVRSIFWQNTIDFSASGLCFSRNNVNVVHNVDRSGELRNEYLVPGTYKVVFFADGSYAANDKYTTKITVSDHNYSNVSVTSKATLEADGLITKTCKCDKTQTEAISKIAEVSIGSDEYPLVGDDVTPVVTVKDSKGNDLVKDTDYTVSYVNNDKVTDEAKVVVTFKGDYYEGTKEITFKIVENHTHDPYDKIEKASFTKDGAIYKDYCNCGEQAGETVVIKALMSAALDETWFFYDGSAKTPSVVVTDGEGNALVSDKDFTVSYNNNTEAGKATATVNVNNAYYEGSKDLDFSISKIKLDKSTYHQGDEIKVTAVGSGTDWVGLYKKNDGYDPHNGGIQSVYWYYVSNDDHTSGQEYVLNTEAHKQPERPDGIFHLPIGEYKVGLFANDGYTLIGDPVYFTIKGHEYNTTKVTKATFGKDGKIEKLCSCGEASSDVTVIKAIDTIALEKDYFVFEDKAVTPAVVIKDVDGNDINANYTIDYKDNDKIGVATATVTFDDDKYEGTKELKFTIASNHTCDFKEVVTKATFSKDGQIVNKCECGETDGEAVVIPKLTATLEKTEYDFDGSAKTPAVEVKSGDEVLVSGKDYTVAYANNTASSKIHGSDKTVATATVTINNEHYEDSKAFEFKIAPFTLDKDTYYVGDDILVTAYGSDLDWVGVYKIGDVVNPYASGGIVSLYWYYVNNTWKGFTGKSGETYAIQSTVHNPGRETVIPAGDYKMVFFSTKDGNDYYDTYEKYFKIVEETLPENVTIALDKNVYNIDNGETTVTITGQNVTTKDTVAVYNTDTDTLAATATFNAEGKATINIAAVDAGNYKAVALYKGNRPMSNEVTFTVSRQANLEKGITLVGNRTSFCYGEEIKVTGIGSGRDWVGIYLKDDGYDPKNGGIQSIYWYYVSDENHASGQEYVLNSEAHKQPERPDGIFDLPNGNYKVCLFENDGYTVLDRIDIKIVSHNYKEVERKVSTCYEAGFVKYECETCKDVNKVDLELARHDLDIANGVEVVKASCEGNQFIRYTCKTNGCGQYEDIEQFGTALNHDFKLVDSRTATCTLDGYNLFKCQRENCGKEKKEVTTKDHDYKEVIITPATCLDKGSKNVACSVCGTAKDGVITPIPALGHKMVKNEELSYDPACETDGYEYKYCQNDGCSYFEEKVIETTISHNYVENITPATLESDGLVELKCSNCQDVKVSKVVNAVTDITISDTSYVYDGKDKTPAVTVKDSAGNTLTADDYTVAYASNNAVGKGIVTVTLKGDLYSGTVTKEFDIKLATPTIKSGKYQNGIVVKWSVVAGATGYNVYRKDMTTEGADWEKIATTVGKSYIDTKLTSGNAYSYKVEAYFRGFNSASKETKAVVYLSIPTATAYNAAKGITVEWDAQDGATRYHVFRRDYINGAWSEWVRVRTTETTSFVDAKAISGTRYQYKVYSATETDKSIASAIVLELRLATTTVKASNASGNAKITWSKVKGTTTYDVMRRTYTNGKWSAWKVVKNTSSLSYIDKSVKSGTKYQYKVVAKNGTKYVGAQSAAVTNLYLAASASIKATVAANGYKLTWSKVTGAASYNVYRSVYKNGKWTSWTKIANTKSLSYTDKNLTSGTNCKYKVVAVNGTYTSAGKGTANMRFVAPTAKVTATGTSKGFNVSWSKVAGAKGYYVYRREYKNGAWSAWTRIKTVNSGSTVKLTDTKNVKNVKYQYSVKAFSGSFTSALTISSVAKR